MSILQNYHHFGGTHWETAALKNALAYTGIVSPVDGKPLSEAICLGLMGGIAAGYSFCPSIPQWEEKLGPPPEQMPASATHEDRYMSQYRCGSGISIVCRYHSFSTGADKYDVPLKRLGCKTFIKETAGAKAAQQHLIDAIAAGRPALIWTAAMKLTWHGWAGTCGMYTTLCHGIDEEKGLALLSDRGKDVVVIPLDDLAFLRGRVCSFKNRLLSFEPPAKLNEKTFAQAIRDGIKDCAADFLKPKLGTFNLPGILEWSKVIASEKNKKGWPVVYPGGRLYLPLRDAYDSIETAGTGGGLMRGLFADCLDEASALLNRPALRECAAQYRLLAAQWTQLAQAILPDAIKPFKQTKSLLHKRNHLATEKGSKGNKEIDKASAELRTIENLMRQAFPMNPAQTKDLLSGLATTISDLHAAETDSAALLAKAIK